MGVAWRRFPAGVALFALGFRAPLAIPPVVASELRPGWETTLSGAIAFRARSARRVSGGAEGSLR
jgi:hypothetical protein